MSANSETGDHLDEIYDWIDQIKFSRPKRNIARDFSDGGNEIPIISNINLSILLPRKINGLPRYK